MHSVPYSKVSMYLHIQHMSRHSHLFSISGNLSSSVPDPDTVDPKLTGVPDPDLRLYIFFLELRIRIPTIYQILEGLENILKT
jgi:hypothetical protein